MEAEPEREVQFQLNVPAEQEAGSYANFLSVWHTSHEFTLDFGVQLPPVEVDANRVQVPIRVTARLKVPPTVLFDIIRAINANMTRFEDRFGAIRRPGDEQPLMPPEEPS
jgi:hypothetical protein